MTPRVRSQNRRRLVQGTMALAGFGLLTGCGLASVSGRRSAGPRLVGFLDSGNNPPTAIRSFTEGLRDLGHVEGQDVVVEYRDAEGDLSRLPILATDLVRLPVEILVVANGPAALAASRATSMIPIVVAGGNVITTGLVTNIAHPEGNVTSVATNAAQTLGKWLELLKEVVPALTRLAAVFDGKNVSTPAFLEQLQHAAATLGLQLLPYDLRDLEHLPMLLSTAKAAGAEGLVVVSGGVLGGSQDPRIGQDVLLSRLPAVAESRAFVVAGGLLAHGPNLDALAERSAYFVDKLLKGAQPSELPIELPTTFDIIVNVKTARELGLQVPLSILQQATEVIQ